MHTWAKTFLVLKRSLEQDSEQPHIIVLVYVVSFPTRLVWAGNETSRTMSVPPLERKYVKSKLALLRAGLQTAAGAAEQLDEALGHIRAVDGDPNFRLDPEFPPGLEWFNTDAPLAFSGALRGKIVVLDFFTYCCINCVHVLPDLARLEDARAPGGGEGGVVVVVGVHSAKFDNEKASRNIRDAILRYGIRHAVVNDAAAALWERLGVTCWPTLVVLGPSGQLLHCIIGEGHGEELMVFVDAAVQHFTAAGQLNLEPIKLTTEGAELRGSVLKFPGKICVDPTGKRLYVSDTGHHRVLVVERETGSGKEWRQNYGENFPHTLRPSPPTQVWWRVCMGVVRLGGVTAWGGRLSSAVPRAWPGVRGSSMLLTARII